MCQPKIAEDERPTNASPDEPRQHRPQNRPRAKRPNRFAYSTASAPPFRVRHYSPLTEKAYIGWIKRFIFFFDKRDPDEMGESDISAYISHLATEKDVSASTQNQALSALLFLYSEVLD